MIKASAEGGNRTESHRKTATGGLRFWIALRTGATAGRMFSAEPAECLPRHPLRHPRLPRTALAAPIPMTVRMYGTHRAVRLYHLMGTVYHKEGNLSRGVRKFFSGRRLEIWRPPLWRISSLYFREAYIFPRMHGTGGQSPCCLPLRGGGNREALWPWGIGRGLGSWR